MILFQLLFQTLQDPVDKLAKKKGKNKVKAETEEAKKEETTDDQWASRNICYFYICYARKPNAYEKQWKCRVHVWAMFSLNRDKEFLQASCRSAWLIPEASTKAVFLKPLVCLVYADCFLRRRCVMQQVMALVWNGCNSKPIRIMVVNGCTLT